MLFLRGFSTDGSVKSTLYSFRRFARIHHFLSHPPLFCFFLPGARPGARLVVALHCVHNNALSIGAGAGQDILPRHFIIMTIVKLGSPRIPG